MIVVSGVFEVTAATRGVALEAARRMTDASVAEPGCLSYEFFVDLENPNRMRVFEEWENQEALDLHFATPHMKEFRKRLADVSFVSRQVTRYIVVETSSL